MVFQCPTCKEYINTSMRECRFCGSSVDYGSALAAARTKQRIDEACHQADVMHSVIWFIPLVCWASGTWVYIYWEELPLIPLGFIFLPGLVLIGILQWWLRFWEMNAEDARFEKAKRTVKLSFWVCLLTYAVPLIVIMLARAAHGG